MATRLRRLKVEQFRDVRPGTELRFGDGWNVVLGRNGSGKTTLLHLISMVLRDDLSALRGEEFAIEYDLEELGGGFTVSVRNVAVEGPLPGNGTGFVATTEVHGNEPDGLRWTALIPGGEPMRIVGDERLISPQDPIVRSRFTASLFARQVEDGMPKSALLEWPHLMPVEDRYRIDEGVAMFDAITGVSVHPRASGPRPSGAGMLKHLEGTSAIDARFVPELVSRRMADAFSTARTTVEFDLGGGPLLDRCVELLGARRVVVTATLTESPARGRWFDHFVFHTQVSDSRLVHHNYWSFGQQRLLTIFWYLACNPEVVVADELVNGLHWEWIEACVEAIGDRQVFVAVQNPLLLEHVGFATPEDVQRAFVLCRSEPRADGSREMVWVQPDARQAESFFRAWSSGIQPVHEVLKTEGLW